MVSKKQDKVKAPADGSLRDSWIPAGEGRSALQANRRGGFDETWLWEWWRYIYIYTNSLSESRHSFARSFCLTSKSAAQR